MLSTSQSKAMRPFGENVMQILYVVGDLLERVKMFARMLGWKKELEKLISDEHKKLEVSNKS